MPSLTGLEELSADEAPKIVQLSPMTHNLLLALLWDHAQPYQWTAETDGAWRRCTAEERDRADGYQGKAVEELLTEANLLKPGMVMLWAASVAPDGWLLCDGTQYRLDEYPALYDAIGTIFGGSIGSTFNVPNLTGRYAQGYDGNNGDYVGTVLGAKLQTLVPQHRHQEMGGTHALYQSGSGAQSIMNYSNNAASSASPQYTANVGEASGVDQRPPTLVLNYIIYAGG